MDEVLINFLKAMFGWMRDMNDANKLKARWRHRSPWFKRNAKERT
jgi:hypothetical protein